MTKKKKVKKTRVSLCTPTFNRRPFIKAMIDNVMRQTYPKELIEWIIIDDGTDPIGDLVIDIPFVKYFYLKDRISLGKKRNFMHDKCDYKNDNDIIVYIDDDDYYPPERVSHAVETLNNCDALCAGSSELYLWFNELNEMYKFGPYGKNHSTAGTFAFKRKLLQETHYEDNALLAEEKFFLKNYTIPFVQLDPLKTILVIAHRQNTFDKKRLINVESEYCKKSSLNVSSFIKSPEILNLYTNVLDEELKKYNHGDISNKPEVIKEIKRRDEERQQLNQNREIILTENNGNKRKLTMNEVINLYESKVNENKNLMEENKRLKDDLELFKNETTVYNDNDLLLLIKNKIIENNKLKEENESLKLFKGTREIIITKSDNTKKSLNVDEMISLIELKIEEIRLLKENKVKCDLSN